VSAHARTRLLGVKTIGVIGGIGPQATMDFEQRVHRRCQELVPQSLNSGYPPTVVYYCRFEPWAGRGDDERARPNPKLLDAARYLGQVSDFIVITSNATHLFRPDVEEASGRPVLSMVDAVLDEIRARGAQRVGVLGFGYPRVYAEPLEREGIAVETVDGELRERLDDAIPKVFEGREDDDAVKAAHDAVAELRSRGVDLVVLGCTEIPLLLGDASDEPDLVNPLPLLVDATVTHAVGAVTAAAR
jgi:aspartate racemase